MGRFVKKIKNKQYGQAMAEFALTIPIFLLLVFGVIELSRFFLTYSAVFTATREASRYGSAAGTTTRTIDGKEEKIFQFEDCFGIKETAVRMGNLGGVQDNDVTIYYESTPGTIVARCPDNNPETVPIEDVCVSDGCVYTPKLGDRVLVKIVTDFDSLLGIVPDLPVSSTNGRTIMKELKVYSDPVERIYCDDVVEFSDNSLLIDTDENKVYIHVINDSTVQHYIIYEILNIDWNVEWTVDGEGSDVGLPDLKEIRWNNKTIWTNSDPPEQPEELGEDNIVVEQNIDILWTEWDSENFHSLPAKDDEDDVPVEVPLEFVFFEDGLDLDNLNFNFDLIVVHAGFSDDKCNPVGFGD